MGKIFSANRKSYSLSHRLSHLTLQNTKRAGLLACVICFGNGAFALNTDLIAPEKSTGTYNGNQKIAHGQRFMAVTANPLATQTAYKILDQGGSAIDAAIAAQMVLGLVEPQSSGIGGGGFLLHWNAKNKELKAYNGRETAPEQVNENHFIDNGQTLKFFDAVIGGYSVGTPGLLAMLELAHQEQGKLAWKSLFDDAITLSEQGFSMSQRLHQLSTWINSDSNALSKDTSNTALAKLLLTKSGQVKPVGTPIKNPAYAKALRLVAEQKSAVFYQGEIASHIVNAVNQHPKKPGVLSLNDLKKYDPSSSEAICINIREYKVCGSPPPASGPLAIMQQLIMLDSSPQLVGIAPNGSAFFHRYIEASKLSFADRNTYIADPEFVDIDTSQLLAPEYLKLRAQLINPLKASKTAQAGRLATTELITSQSLELPSTTHISIQDSEGNIVSLTSSIETAFGSRVMVDGFLLNNQLTDFSFIPTQGSQTVANRIEPGKQPRSSMSPIIVFKNDQPYIVIGSPGGARIINYVGRILAQHLLLDMPLTDSINSLHVSNLNQSSSRVEAGHKESKSIASNLSKLGHEVKLKPLNSGLHIIEIQGEQITGIADTRREGAAAGR